MFMFIRFNSCKRSKGSFSFWNILGGRLGWDLVRVVIMASCLFFLLVFDCFILISYLVVD